jgi:hypothetical protein
MILTSGVAVDLMVLAADVVAVVAQVNGLTAGLLIVC